MDYWILDRKAYPQTMHKFLSEGTGPAHLDKYDSSLS